MLRANTRLCLGQLIRQPCELLRGTIEKLGSVWLGTSIVEGSSVSRGKAAVHKDFPCLSEHLSQVPQMQQGNVLGGGEELLPQLVWGQGRFWGQGEGLITNVSTPQA